MRIVSLFSDMSVWKTFSLIIMAKSDFVYSVATNSTSLSILSQQIQQFVHFFSTILCYNFFVIFKIAHK